MVEKPKRKEIMRITVFDNNTIELIVDSKKRHITKIKFKAEMGTVPTLETSEPIVDFKETANETNSNK